MQSTFVSQLSIITLNFACKDCKVFIGTSCMHLGRKISTPGLFLIDHFFCFVLFLFLFLFCFCFFAFICLCVCFFFVLFCLFIFCFCFIWFVCLCVGDGCVCGGGGGGCVCVCVCVFVLFYFVCLFFKLFSMADRKGLIKALFTPLN